MEVYDTGTAAARLGNVISKDRQALQKVAIASFSEERRQRSPDHMRGGENHGFSTIDSVELSTYLPTHANNSVMASFSEGGRSYEKPLFRI